ncbi:MULTISPECIES: dihydrofolate reductase family protein [unclassified Streptomyces]|uniref:dihydrofolate reductase family protein n=1 Tax=unclassified Streptomyces TaxID=2593676 RepID=UPI000ACB9A9A|nr:MULTISPECIES: dihydrofolate reductase family protein [unclassified Streptomyces]
MQDLTLAASVEDWANSTLIRGDLVTAVNDLKSGDGKEITVAGSSTLVRSLLELDLLDELVLLVHPVVADAGRKKLFTDDAPMKRLQLVEARPIAAE